MRREVVRKMKNAAEMKRPINEIREWLVNNANPYTRVEITIDTTKIVVDELTVPATPKENC